MSTNATNQNTTLSEPASIERDENRLDKLNDLLDSDSEATIGERNPRNFDELYVFLDPRPEIGVYVVMDLSAEKELSHIATFDSDDRDATAARTKPAEK